ncbi:hypothetical protein WG66_016918 [Moniliophthora roreri]|nr:hypothetical protein WG66_016918 [Moniliophthora roreri]
MQDLLTKALAALAIGGGSLCLVVEFPENRGRKNGSRNRRANGKGAKEEADLESKEPKEYRPQREWLQRILAQPAGIFAFDIAPLTLSLYSDLNLFIHQDAVVRCVGEGVGEGVKVHTSMVNGVFGELFYEAGDKANELDMMQHAWAAHFVATFENGQQTFDDAPRIDLRKFTEDQLIMLAKLAGDDLRLESLKPMETKHAFSGPSADSEQVDVVQVRSESFELRVIELCVP